MPRTSDEDRKSQRMAKAVRAKRQQIIASGVFTREDSEQKNVSVEHRISASYTVAHDELRCQRCDSMTDMITSTSNTTVRKSWRCPNCLATYSGQYVIYVIREEPWLPSTATQ